MSGRTQVRTLSTQSLAGAYVDHGACPCVLSLQAILLEQE